MEDATDAAAEAKAAPGGCPKLEADEELDFESEGGVNLECSSIFAALAPSLADSESVISSTGAQSAAATADGEPPEKKKKDKKGEQFFCKYSLKWQPIEDKVPSYQVCRWAKRAYDSLYALAGKQGEKAWWIEAKEQPKKLAQAITKYDRCCPAGGGRGTKRAKQGEGFKMVELKEFMKAERSEKFSQRGRMMWKEQYISWAATVDGNMIPRHLGEGNWAKWLSEFQADEKAHFHDKKGPPQEPLRFRIQMYDDIDYEDAVKWGKELSGTVESVKNPNAAALRSMRDGALTGHDTIMGQTAQDQQGVSRGARLQLGDAERDATQSMFAELGVSHVSIRGQILQTEIEETPSGSASLATGLEECHLLLLLLFQFSIF